MNFKEWCEENSAWEFLRCYLNGTNPIMPDQIGYSSAKIVNWKCSVCGLEWKANLNHMNRRRLDRTICPYCAHERASHFYNTSLLYPELNSYWDQEQNSDMLEDYTPGSKYPAVWRCRQHHTWTRPICDQVAAAEKRRSDTWTGSKELCPYCTHQRPSPSYNLEIISPEVSLQWDYSRNGSLTPRSVTPFSQKKVHWVCQFNPAHTWQDRISNRTILLRGCPVCAKLFHVSYPARTIYYYLRQAGIDCIIEKPEGRYSIDVAISNPDAPPIALELDGYYAHQSTASRIRDAKKDAFLKKAGYRVIRVREAPSHTEGIVFENDIITYPYADQHGWLDKLVQFLFSWLTEIQINPDHVKDHWQIERLYYHDRKIRSLAVKYPVLASQWSLRNTETPDVILPGSGSLRWWKCPICEKEYQTSVSNRVYQNSGCPYCANHIVTPESSLKGQYPDIARQWHHDRNTPLKPEEVAPFSRKKVWWICDKGHEWQTSIFLRTRKNGTNCPVCRGHTVIPENSLAAYRPVLASYWHPHLNSRIPEEVALHSNKTFWWKCPDGHEWQDIPNKLQKYPDDQICPYCNNRRLWKGYCLASHNPALSELWHPSKNQYTSQEIAPFSNMRVWWKCPEGHEWENAVSEMQVYAPASYCPYCNNRRVCSSNSLLAIDPDLAAQWNTEKNALLTPDDVFPRSTKMVWWRCADKHEWQAPVAKRYLRGDGCPYCSGRRATPENSLAVNYPLIAADWDRAQNASLTAWDVSPKSGRRIWWKCRNGHSLCESIRSRIKSNGCPLCNQEKIFEIAVAPSMP